VSKQPPSDEGKKQVTAPLMEARPGTEHAIARRIGLGRVLGHVLGRAHATPRVGRFLLEHKLGEGGMGVVYRGRDPVSGELVAIKLLEQGDERARRRFAQEAQTLSALHHPRIVRYLDHGVTDEGFDYLVMEWLDGRDLGHLLRDGPLSIGDTVRIGFEAALGLSAAHAASVLHRDVKPSNLFLVDNEVSALRVIDFGIARASQPGTRLTSTGAVLGTPSYMAPEQVRGIESVRTDVYALGASLFECLTGRPPFVGEHPAAVLLSVIGDPVPSARALRPEVPPALDALVGRMLAKNPGERPLDMTAVLTELSDLRSMTMARESAPALSLSERAPRAQLSSLLTDTPDNANSPLRGRARELGLLRGEFASCEEELTASVVLVVSTEGLGKSALLRSFTRTLRAERNDVLVLALSCGPEHAGAPFALMRSLMRALQALPRQPASRELEEFDTLLRALQLGATQHRIEEVTALADRLRLAWFALLDTLLSFGALVIAVDDAQWMDLSSLRFLKRVLDHPLAAPRMLLLAGRPSSSLDGLAGALLPHTLRSVQLEPLRARSLFGLLQDWAPGVGIELREGLTERAAGHPGRLRALVRSALSGQPLGEGGPLELARQRVAGLGSESRRLLRAASLVSGPFGIPLLAKLVGMDAQSPLLKAQVMHLEGHGLVIRASRGANEAELELDDEFTRTAALELCTEQDLQRGHAAIARFLMDDDAASPVVIAEHLQKAGVDEEAAPYYLRAAQAALAGEDTTLVARLVAAGLRCTTRPELAGLLEAVDAEASFWRGDLRAAQLKAAHAAELLVPQSAAYFSTCSLAVSAAGQMGENDQVRSILRGVLTHPADSSAADARLICLCRGITQLSAFSGQEAEPFLQAVESELHGRALSASARAWVERMQAWRQLGSGFDDMAKAWVSAHGAHARAGDMRAAAQVQITLGSLYVWIGAWERAHAVLDEAALVARRLDSPYLSRWAAYTAGKLATETRPFSQVRAQLMAVIDQLSDSPRMRGGAYVYLGLNALRHDRFQGAFDAGTQAALAHGSPVIQLGAQALQLCALVGMGLSDEVLSRAVTLEQALGSAGRLPEFESLIELAIVQGYAKGGDESAAQRTLRSARERIERGSLTLSDLLARSQFLTRPYAHARLMALAGEARDLP